MFKFDKKINLQKRENDVLTIGELLIDMISLEYDDNFECDTYNKFFGGSPANIAMNLKKLGINPIIVSAVGNDGLGKFLINHIRDAGLEAKYIQKVEHSTSMVVITKSKSNPIPNRGAIIHKQFTMLDCHDGIPVKPDLDDLIDTKEARELIDICLERGSNLSLILSDEHKAEDGFNVHQIRGTYYSVLNCDDDAYLVARAIQFFVPGVPQVYYVGLLAGENDYKRAEVTGDGRAINRHDFTLEEIERSLKKDVIKRLLKLIKFRNDYDAFNGQFKVLESASDEIRLTWQKNEKNCSLLVDLKTNKTIIEYVNGNGEIVKYLV